MIGGNFGGGFCERLANIFSLKPHAMYRGSSEMNRNSQSIFSGTRIGRGCIFGLRGLRVLNSRCGQLSVPFLYFQVFVNLDKGAID